MVCKKTGPERKNALVFLIPYNSLNKAGNTANSEAGDISRRKKVKEKRPSPFLYLQGDCQAGCLSQ